MPPPAPPPLTTRRTWRLGLLALLLVAVLVPIALKPLAVRVIAGRVHATAAGRGLRASWSTLAYDLPARVRLTRLSLVDPDSGDTLVAADSVTVSLDALALLILRPRVTEASVAHARVRRRGAVAADPDTLDPEAPAGRRTPALAQQKVRRAAESLADGLLVPARRLPRLTLHDVVIESGSGGAHFERLDVAPAGGDVRLRAAGVLRLNEDVGFTSDVTYAHDDRLVGAAAFTMGAAAGRPETLRVAVDGRIAQDRRAGAVRVAAGSRVMLGELPITLEATFLRRGPRVHLALAMDSLTAARWKRSLPRTMLGPLEDLAVTGSYDYRVGLDLDLAQPDSVRFSADVIPHGLALDFARTRLDLALEQPFTARIHLPHGRIATRELSPANPNFRPLDRISPVLVSAVLTNEDGGFFHHRGFNTEAIKLAIAANLKAGAYKRGAGTITMQLARNLYLGHERSLSRKGQEVVLAWVLEHLTYLGKERLLEIYLNIIEWGPGVHGANEAARYYFGRDVDHLTIDEALFLTVVIPSPSKWRWRVDAAGELRPFARAQMHFIGRAMIAKGWLDPGALPPADELRIELRGPARELLEERAKSDSKLAGAADEVEV